MIFTLPDYVVFGLEFQVYDSARHFKLILGLYQRYGLQCGNGSIMGSNVLGCSGQGFCSLPLRFLGKNRQKSSLRRSRDNIIPAPSFWGGWRILQASRQKNAPAWPTRQNFAGKQGAKETTLQRQQQRSTGTCVDLGYMYYILQISKECH